MQEAIDYGTASRRLRLLASAEPDAMVKEQLLVAADKYDALARSIERMRNGPRLPVLDSLASGEIGARLGRFAG